MDWPRFECYHSPSLRAYSIVMLLAGQIVREEISEESVLDAGGYEAIVSLLRSKICGMMAMKWPGVRFDLSQARGRNWDPAGRNDAMLSLQAMVLRVQNEIIGNLAIPPSMYGPPR